MRLLICAGGTGGGVYPALTVLQTLGAEAQQALWVGSEGGIEASLVQRESVPYTAIPAAGVHGVGARALPGNVMRLSRGVWASRRILRQFKPDVLLFTGGYVAVPMALAGRNVPTLLFVPDIEPGMALKALARFADRIAVTTDDSRAYFANDPRIVVTGYPVRPNLVPMEKTEARRQFDLRGDLLTLLVSGGSKGARSINRALLAALPQLLNHIQVIHLSGHLDWEEVQAVQGSLSPEHLTRYRPFPYLHEEMSAALSAADLVLSRAGASVLGEYPQFSLPAVLVPYPYAWRYQRVNADYLARYQAAVVLEDADLPADLTTTVMNLLRDPSRLNAMQRAMRLLARPQAAERLAGNVRELAAARMRKGTAW